VNKLIKFELYRNRKKFIIYLGCIILANLILLLLDPDSEKATISISILVVLLPFIYMCMDFIKMLILDFFKDTKYLYLSTARTKNEILGSRLLTTAAYAIAYIIVVSIFQEVNILKGSTFIISLSFSLTALFAQAIIGSTVYKKIIQF